MITLKRKLPPLEHIVVLEIIAIFTIASFFLPGGDDLHRFYRPLAEGCLECGFNPYHTSWLLFPLRFIPLPLLWPVWTLITGLGIYWSMRQLGTNLIVPLLSFPMIGLIWLGQTDVLVIVGLTLALTSKNPYLRGIGLILASIKPQIAGIPALILLWYDRERLKTLIIPAIFFALTFVAWGIDWPVRWLLSDPVPVEHVWRLGHLFPYGLIAFLAVFLVTGVKEKVQVALYASALGLPWFGTYSHIVFLTFFAPLWALPVSYAWLLGWPLMGNRAMRLAWILPVSLLIFVVWPRVKAWRDRRNIAPTQATTDHAI